MRTHAIALAIVAASLGCDSVNVQGRPLSSWTRELDDDEPFKRRNALVALTALAREQEPDPPGLVRALPAIAALLDDPNPGLQAYARDALVAADGPGLDLLLRAMDAPKPSLRFQGAVGVLALDPQHAGAQQMLVQTLTANGLPELAVEAQAALVAVGSPAVPPLIRALDRPDPEARRLAIETLGHMERDAGGATGALTAIARAPGDAEERVAALVALARIVDPEHGLDLFNELRRTSPPEVARHAAVLMRRFEDRDAPTVQQAADAAAAQAAAAGSPAE